MIFKNDMKMTSAALAEGLVTWLLHFMSNLLNGNIDSSMEDSCSSHKI